MQLRTKWSAVIFGGSILAVGAFLAFPDALSVSLPDWFEGIARVLFWPVALCENIVGPGPRIGPPGKQLMEGTPVQAVAAAIGVAFSWMFWSSVLLFARRFLGERGEPKTR